MLETIKQLYNKYKEIINYVFFGVLAAIINLGIKNLLLFTVLDPTNDIQLQIAVIISWIAAVLFAFFTNKNYVFESNNDNKIKEFTNFIIARLSTLLLEMLVMWFFVSFLKLNSDLYVLIFTFISQVLVIIGNYILSKLFVFKKK